MTHRNTFGAFGSKTIELEAALQGDTVDPRVFIDLAAASEAHDSLFYMGYGRIGRGGQFVQAKFVAVTANDGVYRDDTTCTDVVLEATAPWVAEVTATHGIPKGTTVSLDARHLTVPPEFTSRTGWHADHVTIVCASDVLPADTAVGSVDLTLRDRLRHGYSLEARDKFVSDQLNQVSPNGFLESEALGGRVEVVPLQAGYNYLLGPSVQHCEASNMTDQPVERNFLRLGF
ncbi:MAG: hypothetical protein KIH63_005300 [Candidatus Saccharibacteria bacterium]|nr:hypothetical protein [Candidatus Saccharibacteria bacterium]